MAYDFKQGKRNIIDILKSKTDVQEVSLVPSSDQEFTYDNGIKTWVSSIFIDIVDSTLLFKKEKSETLARLMRAFVSELIDILKEDPNQRQIGIRGDCVFGVFSTPSQKDVRSVFNIAYTANTFVKMINRICAQNSFPLISVGIGLGCSKDLIIKAGSKGTGINDLIWIGDAVVDASKLSSEANRHGHPSIMMDSTFYFNIENGEEANGKKARDLLRLDHSSKLNENVYSGDVVDAGFNDWIEGGMQ